MKKESYSSYTDRKNKIKTILSSPELRDFVVSRIAPLVGEDELINSPPTLFDEDAAAEPDPNRPIPKNFKADGAIAGGSIANLVNEYIYGVPAVINDVDFFHFKFEYTSSSTAKEELYAEMEKERKESGYQILGAVEEGLINKILVKPHKLFTKWNYITDSFDLNCVKVGIKWDTKEIFYSHSFLEFLVERRIKIDNNVKFSLTTLVRAHFKKNEMQAEFFMKDWLERALFDYALFTKIKPDLKFRLLSNPREIPEGETNPILQISAKRLKLFESNPLILAPYFRLEGHILVWTGSLPWVHLVYEIHSDLANSDLDDTKKQEFLQRELDRVRELGLRTAIQVQDVPAHQYAYEDDGDDTPVVNQQAFSLTQISEAMAKRIKVLIQSGVLNEDGICAAHKAGVLTESFSEKRALRLREFLFEHNFNRSYLLIEKYAYSIKDLIELFAFTKRLPLHLIGTMEMVIQQLSFDHFNRLVSSQKLHKVKDLKSTLVSKNFAALRDFLDVIYEDNLDRNVLRERSNLKGFKKYIKELVLQSELTQEGESMNHCVGGYGTNVRDGRSRIFHFDFLGEKSTLEVVSVKDETYNFPDAKFADVVNTPEYISKRELRSSRRITYWTIQQHKGVRNVNPSHASTELAKLLVSHLNNMNVFVPRKRKNGKRMIIKDEAWTAFAGNDNARRHFVEELRTARKNGFGNIASTAQPTDYIEADDGDEVDF